MTPEQRAQLLEQARAGTFRTYDEARQWVEQTFGVRYSYKGMYSAKAAPAQQAAWKRGA